MSVECQEKYTTCTIPILGVIHLACTHKWGRGGLAKVHAMCTRGMGLTHLATYAKVPFCMYFILFLYARPFNHTLLTLVMTFITVL